MTARRDRPLDGIASVKVKIGVLVAASIVAAAVVLQVGDRTGVPGWLTLPATLVAALAVTQWLARGMTSPLREMTDAAGRMATGDHSIRVTATSADEVGRLARAFNTMSADLAAADRERRQLVATVSHELRTPLAAQRALLENLVDGVVRPDDTALQDALTQSERLGDLVADLLDLSRIDGGAAPLRLAPVTVRDLLDTAAAEARVGARDTGVEVTVAPADLVVHADAARLAQVVVNLLDNAIRHGPPHGVVRVRAGVEGPGHWWLEVTDDGPGIPEKDAERIFTRFGVGDDNSGGTGLGLSIASWVCRLHGGSIAALRPDGDATGARVRAVLPRRPGPPVSGNVGAAPPAPAADRPSAATEEVTVTTPDDIADDAADDESGRTAPLPSVIDSVFGDRWPERGPRTAPFPLFASVAVGAAAALILPDRYLGLGFAAVLWLAGALVVTMSVYRRRPWTITVTVLGVALTSLVVLRAAEWLAVLSVLLSLTLLVTALTDARRLVPMVAGGAAWVLSGIRGLPLLGRTLAVTTRHRLLWPILRTTVICLVALVVFGGLFASGDAVFGSWVARALPDVHLADSLVLRVFVWFFVAGVVLAGCYLALNPPRVESVTLPPARSWSRPWEWLLPVGVIIAVFVGFLLAQASAMWGGHDYVQRTTGTSYADYVHQGFAQLTAATALTLLTIGSVARRAPRTNTRDRRLLQVALGTLCVLTLVVVASALFRMWVYQQAYGFTVLRVLVDVFELWLGLLVVFVMIAGIRLSGWWLPRAALVSGAVLLLTSGLANPEAWVADRNIDRFASTGKLDLDALADLGPDAAPTIAARLPGPLADCVLDRRPVDPDDLLEWNLGRARAAGLDGGGSPTAPGVECPSEIGG